MERRGIRRIGLPGELIEMLDEIAEDGGYPNRVAALEPLIKRAHKKLGRGRA